jgi:hypothetical protein
MSSDRITPAQARDYLDRWKLVKQAEAEELRTVSLETKLQQLSVLMASRGLFAADPARDREIEQVRDRWLRIFQALRD